MPIDRMTAITRLGDMGHRKALLTEQSVLREPEAWGAPPA